MKVDKLIQICHIAWKYFMEGIDLADLEGGRYSNYILSEQSIELKNHHLLRVNNWHIGYF